MVTPQAERGIVITGESFRKADGSSQVSGVVALSEAGFAFVRPGIVTNPERIDGAKFTDSDLVPGQQDRFAFSHAGWHLASIHFSAEGETRVPQYSIWEQIHKSGDMSHAMSYMIDAAGHVIAGYYTQVALQPGHPEGNTHVIFGSPSYMSSENAGVDADTYWMLITHNQSYGEPVRRRTISFTHEVVAREEIVGEMQSLLNNGDHAQLAHVQTIVALSRNIASGNPRSIHEVLGLQK